VLDHRFSSPLNRHAPETTVYQFVRSPHSPFMNSNKHIDGCFTNTLSRRRFLTRSAIVAAGTQILGGWVVDTTRASSKSVKELQQDFLKLKFGMFIHFNLETFKGVQWVAGYHSPADFKPGGKVDTDAWADAAVSAGMKYAVLTAKHVSGFCLWDSKYTTYDVMNPQCSYQQDLVAQFIKSFKSRGLEVGLYYCWRNPGFKADFKVLPPECDPATHSPQEQIEFQKKQIAELVEKYPEVFYIWNDGLDPEIMTAEDATTFFRSLGRDVLASSNWWDWKKKGTPYADIAVKEMRHFPEDNQAPGETCWELEQGWFWKEGARPKTAKAVLDLLQTVNTRHSNFLLNVGPNRQGRFEEASVKVLAEVGKLRDSTATDTTPK
jgi:alpha-L-fucosidase